MSTKSKTKMERKIHVTHYIINSRFIILLNDVWFSHYGNLEMHLNPQSCQQVAKLATASSCFGK